MIAIVEIFWLRLHSVLRDFATKLAAIDPTLISKIEHRSNDAFLLRGHLTLMRNADGEELAITIDVRNNGQQIAIDADVCLDDGSLIATGPATAIRYSEDAANIEVAQESWLREFEQFLLTNEALIVRTAAQLA